jgi:hypothetical protein
MHSNAVRQSLPGDCLPSSRRQIVLYSREIFEQYHLYFDEDAAYDDYYEGEGYYPEEEGLEELVGACIDALVNCLTDERTDRVAREKCIVVLFATYRRDLHAGNSHGFAGGAADLLVKCTKPLEQQTMAQWVRNALADEEESVAGSERQAYGGFLLKLEQESLDDEAYLRI